MDDMYRYAAEAADSNSQTTQEQDDIVLKTFTSFGWGQRFTSFIDTVKKQSEVIVDVTKRDLEEFAQVLRDETITPTRDLSSSIASTSTSNTVTPGSDQPQNETKEESRNETDAVASSSGFYALRDNLGKLKNLDLGSLKEGLSQTLNQTLPAQLGSVRLPGNLDIDQLKTEMAQGTKFAEQYLQKFGDDVINVLSKTVTILEPEDNSGDEGTRPTVEPQIFASRKEALLAKMRNDPDTFLVDPLKNSSDTKIIETFIAGFNIAEYTDEIARLLDEYPDLREMMDKLVPIEVSYELFWQRYYYHAWKIDQDEKKRQMIVKGVEEDEDADFKWDSDDEDTKSPEDHKQKKNVSDGETDFSNISGPASTEASIVSPPLKSQADGDEWVKTDGKKKDEDEDDSDSDWE